MSFEWTPPGTHGIHIGIEFWDNNSQQYWSVECWVEDSGSFVVGAEHLQHMPLDLNGEVWLRHYVTKELEAGPEDIPVYSVGAYRKRWFLILLEEDDKPVDG